MINENSMDDLFLVDCDFNWADEFDLAGFEMTMIMNTNSISVQMKA